MLNPFPDLLAFLFFAPFILRLAAGILFLDLGWNTLRKKRIEYAAFFESAGFRPGHSYARAAGALESITGVLLITGLWTQIAALIAALISGMVLLFKLKDPARFPHDRRLFLLLFVVSLSLLVTGAGFFAFDLPF